MTPAPCASFAELRFDILGCRIQIETRSRVVQHLIRGLYTGYPDNQGNAPDAVFQLQTIGRNGTRFWRLSAGGEEIAALPRLGPMLSRLEYEICHRVIAKRRDRVMLHGAVLSRGGTSLFISGPSGAGKSTLGLALSAHGFRIDTDDVALLDIESATVDPIPRCFHLDVRSKRLLRHAGIKFPEASLRNNFVTPADLETCTPRSFRLDNLVFLDRTRSSSPCLAPLSQAEMTAFLLHESAWGGHAAGEVLSALIRVTRQARCYKLVMGQLDASAQLLDELICSRQASTA